MHSGICRTHYRSQNEHRRSNSDPWDTYEKAKPPCLTEFEHRRDRTMDAVLLSNVNPLWEPSPLEEQREAFERLAHRYQAVGNDMALITSTSGTVSVALTSSIMVCIAGFNRAELAWAS